MSRYSYAKELDPYERKMVNLLDKKGKLKFREIIMRLGLSARHGERVLNSLQEKNIVKQTEGTLYKIYQEA